MAWDDIVRSQMHQLNLIASWASQVQLGRVRDLCREASSELKHELDRLETIKTLSLECRQQMES